MSDHMDNAGENNMSAELHAELSAMLERLAELKESGMLDAYTLIVGKTGVTEVGSDGLAYQGCCSAHMCDFLSPDISLSSPNEDLRRFAEGEMLRSVAQAVSQAQEDAYEEERQTPGRSPYAEFRDVSWPSQN